MAAPAKQTSRWGSFLQQAVAGVESSLDNILAGTDESPKAKAPPSGEPVVSSTTNSLKADAGNSRSSSTNSSSNDRLQERLARAIAAKNYASQKRETSRSSSPAVLRTEAPSAVNESPRRSVDAKVDTKSRGIEEIETDRGRLLPVASDDEVKDLVPETEEKEQQDADGALNTAKASIEANETDVSMKPEARSFENTNAALSTATGGESIQVTEKTSAKEERPQNQLPNVEQPGPANNTNRERQEEIHEYIERIDTLQAKLQYLARESAFSARKLADAASPNSAEKRLAEKEEQIALLMEEGQKLSKTELRHMNTIKKLRTKASESEKEVADMSRKVEKAEKEKAALAERLKSAEATERQSQEKQKLLSQLQKDLDAIKADRDAKNVALSDLKSQVSESATQATADEVKPLQAELDKERRRATELENDISSIKIEKELEAATAKAQLDELKAKSEREVARARIAELELRGEQQMLESRLEIMRARAEEVSSGTIGDAQAKLLRQVETLQSQHAIASENWQGIEASLRSRLSSLEKERDEALKRETDIRRKAREVAVKGKQNENDLDDARERIGVLLQKIDEQSQQMERLQRRADEAQAALLAAQKSFEQDKQNWKLDLQQRIDEEKEKWREEGQMHHPFSQIRAESPMASSQKGLMAEYLGLQNLQARRASSRSNLNDLPDLERRISRPSSAQRMQSSGHGTPQRQDSSNSLANGELTETPLQTVESDDFFENVVSPSSPHHLTHDIISVSTVGAGPSVQLVERMSAAIRRLESEKVSTKEEVSRLTSQRDEARAEIVTLIQELESKRGIDRRVQQLEEENRTINARYQTTLEMLGEKSELVEELRADVDDVKAMYRELVERTIK